MGMGSCALFSVFNVYPPRQEELWASGHPTPHKHPKWGAADGPESDTQVLRSQAEKEKVKIKRENNKGRKWKILDRVVFL